MVNTYKMDKNEVEIYEGIKENAVIFLKDALKKFVNLSPSPTQEEASLLVANIQTCIELACKASFIKKVGLKRIVTSSDNEYETEVLLEKFERGSIKLQTYDWFKKELKNNYELFKMKIPTDFDKLKMFQYYRNRIMHFRYEFKEEELENLRTEVLYIMKRIILNILFESDFKEMHNFLCNELDFELRDPIIRNRPFREMIHDLCVKEYDGIVYDCPMCEAKTLVKDDYFNTFETYHCMNCYWGDDGTVDLSIECPWCKKDGYSAPICFCVLNLDNNNNKTSGVCLLCQDEYYAHFCPNCGNPELIDEFEYYDPLSERKCSFCGYVDKSKGDW